MAPEVIKGESAN
jgi:serine/threonine protein kinase